MTSAATSHSSSPASYMLQATSYKLQATSYKLQATSHIAGQLARGDERHQLGEANRFGGAGAADGLGLHEAVPLEPGARRISGDAADAAGWSSVGGGSFARISFALWRGKAAERLRAYAAAHVSHDDDQGGGFAGCTPSPVLPTTATLVSRRSAARCACPIEGDGFTEFRPCGGGRIMW